MYSATILADSISPPGYRLTTMEVTLPRIVLAEMNTHRLFSRNAASSRAIPVKRMIEQVKTNPFVPERFPINGKGMQPGGYYEAGTDEHRAAERVWLAARDNALDSVARLTGSVACGVGVTRQAFYLSVHKQIANRLLEPWMWTTVVVSGTQREDIHGNRLDYPGAWSNFFAQRCDENAQEQIRAIAHLMQARYDLSKPRMLEQGDWHLPYLTKHDFNVVMGPHEGVRRDVALDFVIPTALKMSTARCARVSYKTHATDESSEERVPTVQEDCDLHDKLAASGHWSPFEHVARPVAEGEFAYDPYVPHHADTTPRLRSNFDGWVQYRKTFKGECR